MSDMKVVTALFLIQLALPLAEFSSQRQGCVRTGTFDTNTKGMDLVTVIKSFFPLYKIIIITKKILDFEWFSLELLS